VSDSSAVREASDADQVIFCGPDVKLVSELRDALPEAPIVVVSRYPEVSGWLDSIEAGASDYCAAPFESAQLKWILESARRSRALSRQ
jgi:DNA-binding NtrC family response regulator